ncbi:hypothetical protein C2S51_027086 [Perilla frutescens var. frutescens]|nr:hypothetical protein C2S51_027086 [Perilla frutescens var. frutescens]
MAEPYAQFALGHLQFTKSMHKFPLEQPYNLHIGTRESWRLQFQLDNVRVRSRSRHTTQGHPPLLISRGGQD